MSSTPSPDAFEVAGHVLLTGVSHDSLAEHWIARRPGERSLVQLVRLTPRVVRDAESARAFVEELGLLRRVDHPGVLRVIDARREGDAVIGVLELVQGVSLRDLLAASEDETLPLSIVVRLAHDLGSALAAIAAEGIAHGDLTPSSILLLPGGVAAIAPTGLARAVCRAGALAPRARLAFKAPEQLEAQSADARSDVFSLAATLFEALAGREAFAGDGVELISALERGRSALELGDAALPEPVLGVLARALDRDPERRPQSARALARSLEDAAGVEPAPRFELAALVMERSGRDLAALRFEVELLTGKPADPEPGLDAETTPRSGPPPRTQLALDTNEDLFEDTQPSLAKRRDAEQRRRHKRTFTALVVAGLAVVGFAVGAGLRTSTEAEREPASPPPAKTEERPVVPPPVLEPAGPEPDDEAVSEPAAVAEPNPAAATARAPKAPPSAVPPAPVAAAEPPSPKPRTTESREPPRAEPPMYASPPNPPSAPTIDIPSGI